MIGLRKSLRPVSAGLVLVVAVTGCLVAGSGRSYADTVGASYGVGFYEPLGHDFGGWGPGYRVGPPRMTGSTGSRALPSRPTPSIPTHLRPHR